MRTELIYLWINKDKNGCFQQEGFNFSPEYIVSYSPETKDLTVERRNVLNVFYNDKIANVTAIIGENGTGKTTLLEFLTGLSCTPLTKEQRPEYQQWNEEKNEYHSFIAVYFESDQKEFRVINITYDTVIFNNLITSHKTSISPYGSKDFKDEDYVGHISHIYLSNGVYDSRQNQNLRSYSTISCITLTDTTLSTISNDFFRIKYGLSNNGMIITDTPYNALASLFTAQENNQSMQLFIDLLFYIFLSKNNKPFQGKKINNILFSVKSAWKIICLSRKMISYNTKYFEEKYIKSVEEKYRLIKSKINGSIKISGTIIWHTAVCNLVFELLFVFEEYANTILENDKHDIDSIFDQCVKFINGLNGCKEKKYYQDAIKEIFILRKILINAKYTDNLLPQNDMGNEIFAEVGVLEFEPLIDHIKSGCSFLLKYLDIRNFHISSGERALLNFMSRLYFSSQINKFIPNNDFIWNDSILLLIDEIDLYLHPEWQRQILQDLLKAIQEAFSQNFVQIIVTSHSPIILSDIPQENSIFLQSKNGKIVQVKHDIQTFGANIYSLYKDAFFLTDGLAMGNFAKDMINSWIEEIKAGNKDEDKIHMILDLIGEPIIRKRLVRMVQNSESDAANKTIQLDERKRILEFLYMQKVAIQQQIDMLEGYKND